MLLSVLLRSLIRHGDLTVIDADGKSHSFQGEPLEDIPPVVMRLHDKRLHQKLFFNPRLSVGEAYMDGSLTIESAGGIYDFLALCGENIQRHMIRHKRSFFGFRESLSFLARRLQQYNPISRSCNNVAHHYDLSNQLYDLFLDCDRQYSCAYFPDPDVSLEQAQEAKKRHIAAKLMLKPGMRVLDIGSGWGGLAISLARWHGVDVTGVTLSQEQLQFARRRAADAGLSDRVRFEFLDYRDIKDRFDRIVSVGMFEHVGVNHYRTFFYKIHDLLQKDGIALLHSIGRLDGPGSTNPWLRKYIFPGGYSPALSEVLPHIEKTGLLMTDIEILRLHYAETLRAWRDRFMTARAKIAQLYDERFCRMWEFYLAGSEMTFRHHGHMVFQVQMSKSIDAVPMTRDYIHDYEYGSRYLGAVKAGLGE